MGTSAMVKFVATKTERQAAGRNGGRSRHGETVVYIDGQPVSLQRVSAETGLKVERIAERARAARKRGDPVTMELLTKPLRVQASPGPRPSSGYVVRKALR